LNSRQSPYIEAEAINGRGVLETLKEIARLTVPVVRASVFGEGLSSGEKSREMAAEPARILTTSELKSAVDRPRPKRRVEKNQKRLRLNLSNLVMSHPFQQPK